MNPYKDLEDNSFSTSSHLNYEDIATKLLKDHYFLTALELHTELVESGKELPQLREFFSNPGNFEQHVSRASDFGSMHRTPSQATLDSLDTARYSEDGGGDRGGSGGDVAVLEFELRKARETINSLRANLTQFADSESSLDKTSRDKFNQRALKPHEKRALNFLINEYLLLQDYKLTSITFSDENPDQEFEDWDDVGLNMPRPAGLISLLWGNSSGLSMPKIDASVGTETNDMEEHCQSDLDGGNVCVSCQTSVDHGTDWNHELLIQAEEIELLKQKIIALETEKLNFQKLYDAAIVSLNSLTSPTLENKGLELAEDKANLKPEAIDTRPITCTATENHYGSGNSTHSATPEQFEMIDSEKNSCINRKDGSNTSSLERGVAGLSSPRRGSVTTLDETLSIADANEWTRVPYEYTAPETSNKELWIDSNAMPNGLKMSILNWCIESLNLNEPLENELLAELVNSDKPITLQGLLTLVIDTMPRILPWTVVGRRVEALALLAAAAALAGAADARALHSLLSLVKRPAPAVARQITEAACLIVKWGGSAEVLSAVAELLSSKSPERRILASQICVCIAPYVPLELCTSLLFSLVLLMCESSEPEIRSLGLKSACLICPVAEHKYSQLENLMFAFLKDSAEKNVKDTVNVFVPVLARSALISGKFASDLYSRIASNLAKASAESNWKNVVLNLEIIRELVLAMLAYVVNVQIVRDVTLESCDMDAVNLQEVPLEGGHESFMDLQCFIADGTDAKKLLVAMNRLFKEKPDVRWPELTWFISVVKQILETTINSKILSHPTMYELLISLFDTFIDNFTVDFTRCILKPVFSEIITQLEEKMEKLHAVEVDSTAVVGVYLVTVLPALGDTAQHVEFLQKWVVYSSIRGLPIKIFNIPLKWVATHKSDTLVFYVQSIRELAASSCSVGSGAAIRALAASLAAALADADAPEHCVDTQLLPTVVSLLHDEDTSVRSSAFTAWGAVTRLCLSRRWACEARCWPPVEAILADQRPLAAKEATSLAEALALLVLPTPENDVVSDRAVSAACALAMHAAGSGECALGAARAMQLAMLRAPRHPALPAAVRKLEEIVQTPEMAQYRPVVEALLHNSGTGSTPAPGQSGGSAGTPRDPPRPTNLQTAQEVGRRVTQIFQQSKTNMNLQNIFKKKT